MASFNLFSHIGHYLSAVSPSWKAPPIVPIELSVLLVGYEGLTTAQMGLHCS